MSMNTTSQTTINESQSSVKPRISKKRKSQDKDTTTVHKKAKIKKQRESLEDQLNFLDSRLALLNQRIEGNKSHTKRHKKTPVSTNPPTLPTPPQPLLPAPSEPPSQLPSQPQVQQQLIETAVAPKEELAQTTELESHSRTRKPSILLNDFEVDTNNTVPTTDNDRKKPPPKSRKKVASTGKKNSRVRKPSNKPKPRPVLPPPPQPVMRSQRSRRVPRRKVREVNLSESLKYCAQLVDQLANHEMAWPFNQPVDPLALNIPDYFDIIKRPMDLGTIKENIDNGVYTNPHGFAEDVRLVWKNAITYNQPGSDICLMAQTMSDFFEDKFVQAELLEEQAQSPYLKKLEMQETIRELKDSMKTVEKELSELRKQTPATPPPPKPAPSKPKQSRATNKRRKTSTSASVEPNYRPMSYEEKNKLSQAINGLAPDDLAGVVVIIDEEMPNLTKNEEEEIELDIDALDTVALRRLEAYVRDCSKPVRKSTDRNSRVRERETRLKQTELTESSTTESIKETERQIQALDQSLSGTSLLPPRPPKTSKKKDKANNGKDSSSSSDSSSSDSSSSSSSSSDTDSDSSEDGSEKENKPGTLVLDASSNAPAENANGIVPIDKAASAPPSTNTKLETTGPPLTENATTQPNTLESSQPSTTNIASNANDTSNPTADTPAPVVNSHTPAINDTNNKEQISFSLEDTSQSIVPQDINTPKILPSSPIKKDLVVNNLDSWSTLTEKAKQKETKQTSTSAQDTEKGLWSKFRSRDMMNKQREKDREELEKRLQREKEEKAKELVVAEERRKQKQQEEEEKVIKEVEEAKKKAEEEIKRKREAERAARKQLSEQTIDLDMSDEKMMLESFERGTGFDMSFLKLKPIEEEDDEFREDGEI